MAASFIDIKGWLEDAPEGTAFMIVMCDTFDYDDYPVYVLEGKDPKKRLGGSMQRPMECYDFSLNLEQQLSERRSWNWGD